MITMKMFSMQNSQFAVIVVDAMMGAMSVPGTFEHIFQVNE